MAKPGPNTIYDYSIYHASELLKKDSEVVLMVPTLTDYLHDMAQKAQRPKSATPPTFYRAINSQRLGTVAEFSGLVAGEEHRVAHLPEGNVPTFVLEKIVRAVGRESLIAYLNFTDPEANPDGYPRQLG